MNIEELENQAWALRVKLNRIIESECIGSAARSTPSVRKDRLNHAHARAYSRFLSRQDGSKAEKIITKYDGEPSTTVYLVDRTAVYHQ